MAPSTASEGKGPAESLSHLTVLGLGNDLLADDAFGPEVAREASRRFPTVKAVVSAASGFALLDHILDTETLIVVDTIRTGSAPPGTLYCLSESDIGGASGNSPHFVGLFEVLAAARALGLPAPAEVRIIAAEAADCETVGGPLHPAVRAAIGRATELIGGCRGHPGLF